MSNTQKPSKNQTLAYCVKAIKQLEEWASQKQVYDEQMEAARSYALCKMVETLGYKTLKEDELKDSTDQCQIIAGPYFFNESKKEFFKIQYIHEGWGLKERKEGEDYLWYKGSIANPDLTFITEGNLTQQESFLKLREYLSNSAIISC